MLRLSAEMSTLLLAMSLTAAFAADQSVWDMCTHTGNSDASIAACTKILQGADETTSNRAIALYARAGAYKTKGDNDRAVADYTKAIEANSHYADAYAGRGIVYQIIGNNDDAIADYSKAIEIDPRYANAYVGRGMVYRLKGDSDHAIVDFTRAIEINPRYATAYFNRGSAFEAKGKHDRAIADYTKAIELTPHDAEGYVHRGPSPNRRATKIMRSQIFLRRSRSIRGTRKHTFAVASCIGTAAITTTPFWITAGRSRLMDGTLLPI